MCLNPMHGFVTGVTSAGKKEMFITSPVYDCAEYYGGRWHGAVKGHTNLPPSQILTDYILIPCGYCHECRLKYSRDWATRMSLEMRYHESNYFVTLTYDDEHVPKGMYIDDNGEVFISLSLRKSDVAPFMKRLRRALDYRGRPPIRFYLSGEYGDLTLRPHYHAIIFGLQLDDLEPLRKSKLGNQCYTSQLLQDQWPFGQVIVNEVSFEACAYVARYIMKKQTGDNADIYRLFDIEQEFSQMSRMPGIGKQYFDEHKDHIYRFDELYLECSSGGKTLKPPAYYDRLFGLEEPDTMERIKEDRCVTAMAMERIKQSNNSLSLEEQLQARQRLIEKRVKLLKREEI